MAIPGLKPDYPVKAKVRFGEKRVSQNTGREYPVALDYFVSDDADFNRVCGQKPAVLTIRLPFRDAEDNFSTGLEWWAGKNLLCYAKGEQEGGVNVALRKASFLKGGSKPVNLLADAEVISDQVVGQDRRKIVCPVRDCVHMQASHKKECKPMGRLVFHIDGIDPQLGVFQLDTKSWNSIERIEGLLMSLGDPRGKPLNLRLEVVNRGTDKFTVVFLEAPMELRTDEDFVLADALIQLRGAVDRDDPDAQIKVAIAGVLNLTTPGWRDSEDFVEGMKTRIAERGAKACASALLARHEV